MSAGRILVVEERSALREQLRLRLPDYTLENCTLAADAASVLRARGHVLTLLDLGYLGRPGLELCRFICEELSGAVIVVSPHRDAADCILALEMGADDFVTKPLNVRETVARINTIIHRRMAMPPTASGVGEYLTFGDWRLDIGARELRGVGAPSGPLSSIEFALLRAFASHPKTLLTRAALMDLTRANGAEVGARAIDNQVSRLRKRLGSAASFIRTVREGGYMFCVDVHRT